MIDLSKVYWKKFKEWLIKLLLTRYLPSIAGGPIGYAIAYLAGIILDKFALPIYNTVIRKVIIFFKNKKYKKSGKELKESKNESDFDSNFDNLD